MPLRDDVLTPIAGANPSGQNLRYDPIYDKLKEARREDDETVTEGVWATTRKLAEPQVVIKLGGEALATKSKDLQLAAWLTEALLRSESFGGLLAGIKLLHGLVEHFWDTVYPQVEEDDPDSMELRAAPLEWVGTKLENLLKNAPLNKAKHGWFKYKESRRVGYEADAAAESDKLEKFEEQKKEGKLTADEFDKSFRSTSKDFYKKTVADLDGCLESLLALDELCQEKFGDYVPSFSQLRGALEEVRHTANSLLQEKKKTDPDPEDIVQRDEEPDSEPDEVATPSGGAAEGGWSTTSTDDSWGSWDTPKPEAEPASGGTAVQPAREPKAKSKPARVAVVGLDPADQDDAAARLAAVAAYLRKETPYSPAPYLLLRGFRWGELRAGGEYPSMELLAAPDSEIAQQIRRLASEGNWTELLETAETAMAQPCGRAWLDLQRSVVRACEELGDEYRPIATAIKSELKALLQDLPQLPTWTLMDERPTANGETQAWLKEMSGPPPMTMPAYQPPAMADEDEPSGGAEELREPDAYEIALQEMNRGRAQEALQILVEDLARQRSGRGKFQRKIQIAQLCMGMGRETIARPILEEVAQSIDEHQLQTWEAPDVVAHPLTLLLSCLDKLDGDAADRQKLYTRICRLDPLQALAHAR